MVRTFVHFVHSGVCLIPVGGKSKAQKGDKRGEGACGDVPVPAASDNIGEHIFQKILMRQSHMERENKMKHGFLKKLLITTVITAAVTALATVGAAACTTIYVGGNLTEEGTPFVARTEDYGSDMNKMWFISEAGQFQEGDLWMGCPEYGEFEWRFTHDSYRFTYFTNDIFNGACPECGQENPTHWSYTEFGTNEKGVSVSATETISGNSAVKGVDPNVRTKVNGIVGIEETDIPTIILAEAASAREGVELLADIYDNYGAFYDSGIFICDQNEVWYIENCSGTQYVAIKLNDDMVFLEPNLAVIGEIDLDDTDNVIASKDLIKVAVDAYTFVGDEEENLIDYRASYANLGTEANPRVGAPRMVDGLKFLNNKYNYTAADLYEDNTLFTISNVKNGEIVPMYTNIEPDRVLTKDDVFNFYKLSSVGKPSNQEIEIFQLFADRPLETGTVGWVGVGNMGNNVFVPYYPMLMESSDDIYAAYQESTPVVTQSAEKPDGFCTWTTRGGGKYVVYPENWRDSYYFTFEGLGGYILYAQQIDGKPVSSVAKQYVLDQLSDLQHAFYDEFEAVTPAEWTPEIGKDMAERAHKLGLELIDYLTAEDTDIQETISGAILYQINDNGELEYNVTHAASVDTTSVTVSGKGITSLEALVDTMGVIDKPALVLSTDPGERTIGKAVTADLGLNSRGEVVSIQVTSVDDRPIVGISWKRDTIGTDYQGFAEAYERNGAIAVYLPQVTDSTEARKVLAELDGIFFTGGEDWNPRLYGEEAYPHGSSGWNDARDTSDINLMQQAIRMDVPLFAVCRGEQGFNVAMGGGLIQDVPTYLGQKVLAGEIDESRVTVLEDTGIGWGSNRVPCDPTHYRVVVDGLIHSGGTGYHQLDAGTDGIGVSKDSKWLYDIVGAETIDLIATAHHQAVNPEKLGSGLTVVARSSDGIIEAVEHQSSLFALAIQWHPERDALGDTRGVDVDNDLCNAFLRELVKYAGIYSDRESGGSSSGGGSSSSSSTTYAVTVESGRNGSVTVTPKSAAKNATITVTVAPDKGYALETLTATDKDGNAVKLTSKGNNKYTFTMPASKVTVKATFLEDNTMLNYFVDVPSSAYYYDAVLWAADKGITGGTTATTFSPNNSCTRAQAVTFLWRAAGSPAPKSTVMPFTDVAADAYYHDAVLWAVENGITAGTTATTFAPNATCTRGQIVTFLWRSQKSPAAGATNPFTDVAADAYYANAVLWAVENGVTGGTTATTFAPANDCTRAQIVTFLYRALAD